MEGKNQVGGGPIALWVIAVCVHVCLTHDSDVILYLEQGFLSALSQHAEGVAVVGVVQRHAVHTEEAIAGAQRALPGGAEGRT